MSDASIAEIKKFFRTGDPERDSSKAFLAEWKQLTESDQAEFKALVGAEIG